MKRDNWRIEDHGIRPAGPPDRCLYCGGAKGDTHKADCVIREKTVVVRMIVEYVIPVPEHWSAEQIEYHRNHGSWCADNALGELDSLSERVGCLCNHATFEFVRDATEEDEVTNKLFVADLPS